MLKRVFLHHFLPIVFSVLLVSIFIWATPFYFDSGEAAVIKGKQLKTNSHYANLTSGNQAEIDFISSIKNKKQLTIFGSSEFSDSPYCSYNFLPDSLGLQSLGLGHAYHQHLSILCELLAADEYLDSSKVCIIISPGWFETEGTNTSAFVEFVRPNFLKRIINNTNIDNKYKLHIGKYINNHNNQFEGLSNSMAFLRDKYRNQGDFSYLNVQGQLRQKLRMKYKNVYKLNNVDYEPELTYLELKKWKRDDLSANLQQNFVSSITNNDLYVNDEYYQKYLLDKDGVPRKGSITEVDIYNNNELKDFNLLVNYLVDKSVNCSFVIQPLNPFYYENLEINEPLIDTLKSILEKNNIPYLNMYVSNKKDYVPGTLTDVMHLGDYGWMKINNFLANLYYEKN
jgi:D-alanine transfer protein